MDPYFLLLAILGAVLLLTAWLPLVLKDLPLTLPIACIGIGVALPWLPMLEPQLVNPLENRELTERFTEFVVIVSLMGAELKLDRPVGWRSWTKTWRLLIVSMPLTIVAIGIVGGVLLELSLASALLLGAVLAPTDPVLASDVQVGPPLSGVEDEVRFTLTSEAGLNDGAAFPFVYLAIALAVWQVDREPFLLDWLLVDVVWKLAAGIGIGWIGGRVMGYLMFRLPGRSAISETRDGLAVLGVTCLAYGTTELAHAYGFVAVFVAALALRSVERRHRYHERLHSFAEQIERMVMMALLVCFGAAIAEGSVFDALSWEVVLAAMLILLVIRPLAGYIGLLGDRSPRLEKAVIAYFGIRGLGSFYYLAFALGHARFEESKLLWVTVCSVVVGSIVMHGVTVTPVMSYLDRRAAREG